MRGSATQVPLVAGTQLHQNDSLRSSAATTCWPGGEHVVKVVISTRILAFPAEHSKLEAHLLKSLLDCSF